MAKEEPGFAEPIINAAADVARTVAADAVFAYLCALDDSAAFLARIEAPTKAILICRNPEEEEQARKLSAEFITVPAFNLTRMAQIKMATLIAFSQQVLKAGDKFVFLSGLAGQSIDTLVAMRVGKEFELFQSVGQPRLTEHIRRAVFQKVLTLALELAHEGREGKPVGTLFVIGDHRNVRRFSRESRINPFRGYNDRERNILDDSIAEVVKELAKLDGAFIIKGNGVIVSAGTMLHAAPPDDALPQGLGARHAAACAITTSTQTIAVSLSESTGTVRVWRRGTMITEIEKSIGSLIGGAMSPKS